MKKEDFIDTIIIFFNLRDKSKLVKTMMEHIPSNVYNTGKRGLKECYDFVNELHTLKLSNPSSHQKEEDAYKIWKFVRANIPYEINMSN